MIRSEEQISKQLREIRKLAEKIKNDYQWAMALGLTRSSTDSSNERVSSSGTSDPTAQLATGTKSASYRQAMRKAAAAVDRALGELQTAEAALRNSFSDGQPLLEHPDAYYARTITEEEFDEALDAQERRTARGEGWGAS